MPTYEFICPVCKKTEEVFRPVHQWNRKLKCRECQSWMLRVFSTPQVSIWKPITLEHIAEKPMHFSSKNALKAYCKEKGVISGAIHDTGGRTQAHDRQKGYYKT